MTTEELIKKIADIDKNVSNLQGQRKQLVWTEGVPAIIAKMKELGKDTVYLRAVEDEGYIRTGDLWGYFNNGDYAVKELKLNDDDTLSVVYNTYWNNVDAGQGYWGYYDSCGETVVDEEVSNAIISNIINVLLANDDVYDVESDE